MVALGRGYQVQLNYSRRGKSPLDPYAEERMQVMHPLFPMRRSRPLMA